MIKTVNWEQFPKIIQPKKFKFALSAQIELTYRCEYNCAHCYCRGLAPQKELTTAQWKKIFDILRQLNCLYLTFTGGDPLIRKDFIELYLYAKQQGFIITIFTNGYSMNKRIIDLLSKSLPYCLEVTVNGRTKKTYELITQVKGSFSRAIRNITAMRKAGINLRIKSNCLKQNQGEISAIKKWAESLLGRPAKNKYLYGYDRMIYPRLNRDTTPCQYRLSFEEMEKVRKSDPDINREYEKMLSGGFCRLPRNKEFLYHCDSFFRNVFIDPRGRLKLCEFSDKFSVDVLSETLPQAYYRQINLLGKKKFTIKSACRRCNLRRFCYWCPARAYLETGDYQKPVKDYCRLAKAVALTMKVRAVSSGNL